MKSILFKQADINKLDEKFYGNRATDDDVQKLKKEIVGLVDLPVFRVNNASEGNAAFYKPHKLNEKWFEKAKDTYGRHAISPEEREIAKRKGFIVSNKDHTSVPVLAHEFGHASIEGDRGSMARSMQSGAAGTGLRLAGTLGQIGFPLLGIAIANKYGKDIGQKMLIGSSVGGVGSLLSSMVAGAPTLSSEREATRRGLDAMNRAGYSKEEMETAEDVTGGAYKTYKDMQGAKNVMATMLGAAIPFYLGPGIYGASNIMKKSATLLPQDLQQLEQRISTMEKSIPRDISSVSPSGSPQGFESPISPGQAMTIGGLTLGASALAGKTNQSVSRWGGDILNKLQKKLIELESKTHMAGDVLRKATPKINNYTRAGMIGGAVLGGGGVAAGIIQYLMGKAKELEGGLKK